jgi:hypothetical protein
MGNQYQFDFNHKSLWKARLLSFIIPGSGHLYCEDRTGAIVWFILSLPCMGYLYYLLVKSAYLTNWTRSLSFYSRYGSSPSEDFLVCTLLYLCGFLLACARSASHAAINYNSRIQMDIMFTQDKRMNDMKKQGYDQ